MLMASKINTKCVEPYTFSNKAVVQSSTLSLTEEYQYIEKVLSCAIAAPFYVEITDKAFVDAALIVNNPTVETLSVIERSKLNVILTTIN